MSRYKVVRSRNSSQIKGGKLLMDNGGNGGGGNGGGSVDEIVQSSTIGQSEAYHIMANDDSGAIASPTGLGALEVWSSGKITLSFTYTILSDKPEGGSWTLGDMDLEDISKFLVGGSGQGNLFSMAVPMLDKIAISKKDSWDLEPLILTANLNRSSSDFIPPGLETNALGYEGDELTVTYFGYVDASLFKLNL